MLYDTAVGEVVDDSDLQWLVELSELSAHPGPLMFDLDQQLPDQPEMDFDQTEAPLLADGHIDRWCAMGRAVLIKFDIPAANGPRSEVLLQGDSAWDRVAWIGKGLRRNGFEVVASEFREHPGHVGELLGAGTRVRMLARPSRSAPIARSAPIGSSTKGYAPD